MGEQLQIFQPSADPNWEPIKTKRKSKAAPNRPHNETCMMCGEKFISFVYSIKTCDDCRKVAKAQRVEHDHPSPWAFFPGAPEFVVLYDEQGFPRGF